MPMLSESFDRLSTLPMFRSERPATDEEISRIEAELNVTLPAEYVQFLKRFGYAAWFGREIFGIRPTDPLTGEPSTVTTDCIIVTKGERESPLGTAPLPPNHVVISTDGGGGNFLLFCVGSPYEGQVRWFNLEDDLEPIDVWESLQSYLEHLADTAIEP